jgi:hypothetical protein
LEGKLRGDQWSFKYRNTVEQVYFAPKSSKRKKSYWDIHRRWSEKRAWQSARLKFIRGGLSHQMLEERRA